MNAHTQTDLSHASLAERERIVEIKEGELEVVRFRSRQEVDNRERVLMRREREVEIRERIVEEKA